MRRTFVVATAILVTGCGYLRDPSPQSSRETVTVSVATSAMSPASAVERSSRARSLDADASEFSAPSPRYSVLGCIPSPEVDVWERRLEREAAQWRRMIESNRHGGSSYRTVRRIVAQEGLPPGLALLPAIESGYRRDARGPTGARGLWQFGATTARNYGLVVNGKRDDRTNVELSTRAALRHLRDLRQRYGTWPLALAAYNAGEGRVQRAMRSDSGNTFWRLSKAQRLPPVTRKYVPKFLALVRLMSETNTCSMTTPVVATAE